MQILIDIDAETYNEVCWRGLNLCPRDERNLVKAIRGGKPLPEGHGRIGDLDDLREEVSSWGMNDYEPSDFIDAIDQADTIIEANKEGSDADSN